MLISEDPILSLIVRFVVDDDKPDASNEEFIRTQLRILKEHVERFPEQERDTRTLRWIEKHAKDYRLRWQRRRVSRDTVALRCKNCPLKRVDAEDHCEIHEQWLYLLRRYVAGEIKSKKYVKDTLKLLKAHKKQLKKGNRAGGIVNVFAKVEQAKDKNS